MSGPDVKDFQFLVQYMIARGCVKHSDLAEVIRQRIYPDRESIPEEKLHEFVQSINKRLQKLHIMIRSTFDPIESCRFCVLISTVDNDVTKAAKLPTPKEQEFFKKILQNLVSHPLAVLSPAELKALQIPKDYMDAWISKRWLAKVPPDGITLGVRSAAELDVFIKENYDENFNWHDKMSTYLLKGGRLNATTSEN